MNDKRGAGYVCRSTDRKIIFTIAEPLGCLFNVEIAETLTLKLAVQLAVSKD